MKNARALVPCKELAQIGLVSLDVDGVMTDGGLYFDANGIHMLRFSVLDGMGLKLLKKAGVEICIVTQSNNPIIAARARSLEIDALFLGIEDKKETVETLARDLGIPLSRVCHVADDINDLTLLTSVGVAITVPDGTAPVLAVCDFVTARPGGNGAVREVCDAIIESRRLFNNGEI